MAAPPPNSHRTHLVPTHIRTPETLLTIAGVSLSVRQFLLILVGLSLAYRIWLFLVLLTPLPAGQILRGMLAALPLVVALAFAFVSLAGRTLDIWCVVAIRFVFRPRRFVWRSVRFTEARLSQEEDDDTSTPSGPFGRCAAALRACSRSRA
jgi:hypothetical protein